MIQVIDNSFTNVPLHRIALESNIMSGTIEVGVVSSQPMRDISMLLGNDLTGGEVILYQRVVAESSVSEKTEKIVKRYSGVFPSCVINRAEAQKRAERKGIKEGNNNEKNEVIEPYQKRGKTNPVLAANGPVHTPNHKDVHEDVTGKSERLYRLRN